MNERKLCAYFLGEGQSGIRKIAIIFMEWYPIEFAASMCLSKFVGHQFFQIRGAETI
jgi:hypothetical protein